MDDPDTINTLRTALEAMTARVTAVFEQMAYLTERLTAVERRLAARVALLERRMDELSNPPQNRDEIRALCQQALGGDRQAFRRFNKRRRLLQRQAEDQRRLAEQGGETTNQEKEQP
jgi:uncharacterized coiled-coil protein SlyX